MARRRFSRLEENPRLQTAYTNYKQWQDRPEPLNTPRSASSNPGGYVKRAITPFGKLGDDKVIIKVSRRASNFDPLTNAIGGRSSSTLTGAIIYPGFEPAKVVLFVGTGTTTEERSRITVLPYKKRVGVAYTHAFGGSTGTEGEMEAQDVIANALLAEPNRSVSFQPERRRAR